MITMIIVIVVLTLVFTEPIKRKKGNNVKITKSSNNNGESN